jgi:hypothetical protein
MSQPCACLHSQRHCLDTVSTHLLPTLADMGAADHDRTLYLWVLWPDAGSKPCVPSLSPKVANSACSTNPVHCITENPHRYELC